MRLTRFAACLSASAIIGLLPVKPVFAGCDGLTYAPSILGHEVPDALTKYYPDAWSKSDKDRAVTECREAEAKADKIRREIEALPDSYDRKYSDLTTIDRYKKSLEEGAVDAGRYEKMIEEDAQRRKNGGWVLPASPSGPPSGYYPPARDPNGIRLGVAPKATTKDLTGVKARVLGLKSPGT